MGCLLINTKQHCFAYTFSPTDVEPDPASAWDPAWRRKSKCLQLKPEDYKVVFLISSADFVGKGCDAQLTVKGEEQAEKCGHFLAQYLRVKNTYPVTRVLCAKENECRDTCEIVTEHLKTCYLNETKKCDPCFPETKYLDSLKNGFPGKCSPKPPGYSDDEEILMDHRYRADKFFRLYLKAAPTDAEQVTDIVFAPPRICNYLVTKLLQLPTDAHGRIKQVPCAVTMLVISCDGTVTCQLLGETGFLPLGLKLEKTKY